MDKRLDDRFFHHTPRHSITIIWTRFNEMIRWKLIPGRNTGNDIDFGNVTNFKYRNVYFNEFYGELMFLSENFQYGDIQTLRSVTRCHIRFIMKRKQPVLQKPRKTRETTAYFVSYFIEFLSLHENDETTTAYKL